MFGFLDVPVSGAYHLVSWLASVGHPLLGQLSVALAIVLFTASVRLLLLPLSRAAATGAKARAALMPRMQKLRDRYRNNPQRLQQEIVKLQQESGTSMFTGCLPMLAQIPFFMVMYRLFTSTVVDGQANTLLDGTLFGVPLGQHWLTSAGVSGPHGLVFLALFALLAALAWFSSRWQAKQATSPGSGLLRLLPYGTVLAAAVIPLAAGLYLLITTGWTVVERTMLYG